MANQGHQRTSNRLEKEIKEEPVDEMEAFDLLDNIISNLDRDVSEKTTTAPPKATTEEKSILRLLKSFGSDMSDLFPIFKEEQIYVSQLQNMDSATILALLSPSVKIRQIVELQEKVRIWQRSRPSSREVGCGTDTDTIEVSNEQYTPGQYNLMNVLRQEKGTDGLENCSVFTERMRNNVAEAVARYFAKRRVPFTLAIRNDLAKQLVRLFPTESQYYYSDDGLAHYGKDKFYEKYKFVLTGHANVHATKYQVYDPPPPTATSPSLALKVSSVQSLAPKSPPPLQAQGVAKRVLPQRLVVGNQTRQVVMVQKRNPADGVEGAVSSTLIRKGSSLPTSNSTAAPPATMRPIVTLPAAGPKRVVVLPTTAVTRTYPQKIIHPTTLASPYQTSSPMAPPSAKVQPLQATTRSSYPAARPLTRRYSVAEERPRQGVDKTVTKVTTSSGDCYVIHGLSGKQKGFDASLHERVEAVEKRMTEREQTGITGPPAAKVPRLQDPATDPLALPELEMEESASPGAEEEPVQEEDEVEVVGEEATTPKTNPVSCVNNSPPIVADPSGQEGPVTFIKAARFQGKFTESLASCLELNRNILSLEFEQGLELVNHFRDQDYCNEYVQHFGGVLRKSTRFNIDQKHFDEQPLSKRMALSLFLLPAALNPTMAFVFRGKMITSFISVSPSVQEFVTSLPKSSRVPHVAIIGKLLSPLSYVVYFQKKVYRCVELWHALDMAIKIFIVYKLQLSAECASAWQFVMLHFYAMEQDMEFIYPSVKTLQAFFCLN